MGRCECKSQAEILGEVARCKQMVQWLRTCCHSFRRNRSHHARCRFLRMYMLHHSPHVVNVFCSRLIGGLFSQEFVLASQQCKFWIGRIYQPPFHLIDGHGGLVHQSLVEITCAETQPMLEDRIHGKRWREKFHHGSKPQEYRIA